ncbi:MAG: hypothetical protein SOR89_05850 [Ndongobacter sp.]|nr:hypothetical protein [Ndongobacter sp.]
MKPITRIRIEYGASLLVWAVVVFLFKLDINSVPMWVLIGAVILYGLITRTKRKKPATSVEWKCLFFTLMVIGFVGINAFLSHQDKMGQWLAFLSFAIILLSAYIQDVKQECAAHSGSDAPREKNAS